MLSQAILPDIAAAPLRSPVPGGVRTPPGLGGKQRPMSFEPTGTVIFDDTYLGSDDFYCSKAACLVMQYDGNLVLYKCTYLNEATCYNQFYVYAGWKAMWATGTVYGWNGIEYAHFQYDGNLVVYGPDSTPDWASNTCCWPKFFTELAMQYDGNMVIYTTEGQALWASNTAWRPNT